MAALPWIISWYVLASVVTFGVFALDKRAAERGTRRIRERSLHLLELAGGFPGALAGMRLVRHKNRKWSYSLVTAAIGALHIGAWTAWFILRP